MIANSLSAINVLGAPSILEVGPSLLTSLARATGIEGSSNFQLSLSRYHMTRWQPLETVSRQHETGFQMLHFTDKFLDSDF